MSTKTRNIIFLCVLGIVWMFLALMCWLKPPNHYSDSERRALSEFPELNRENIFSGSFMSKFETYTLDQFPARDAFRSLKSLSSFGVFLQLENNNIYIKNGYISKIEYPEHPEMIDIASEKFRFIYEKYLKDTCSYIYFSIIPDKNAFLADHDIRLCLDYSNFVNKLREKTDYMKYIDIFPLLSLEDYYLTDTHWKQENITDVADKIAETLGVTLLQDYETVELEKPFYGVYYGQATLPLKPDVIKYLTNSVLEHCVVTNFDNGIGKADYVYNMDKANGKDPYEMFLSGSTALIEIVNPDINTDKELIIFRDSFASSLAPLLASGYSKIILVDIRYIPSAALGKVIEFHGQDILFLYSTLVLNNSGALR